MSYLNLEICILLEIEYEIEIFKPLINFSNYISFNLNISQLFFLKKKQQKKHPYSPLPK